MLNGFHKQATQVLRKLLKDKFCRFLSDHYILKTGLEPQLYSGVQVEALTPIKACL